jgi:6-phosphogluconate dehydrogenase (decarboxylating)
MKMLDQALAVRAWSRESGGNYGTKVVAMLRHAFGGHPVKKI